MQKPIHMSLLVVLVSLLVLATIGATPVHAQEGARGAGQIVFGRNVSLEAGETVDGDLVLFGGNLTAGADSRILGDAVVFGGNVVIAGQVNGDVTAIGGNVHLAATARVQGDASALGGRVQRETGAQLSGERVETGRFDFSRLLPGTGEWRLPFATARTATFDAVAAFLRLFRAALISLIVAVIGLLVVLFLPENARIIGNTIADAAPASFGVGLLTMIVGVALIAVLIVMICLAPLGLLLALPLALATLLGWTVTGYMLGQRLMPLLKAGATPAPFVTALVGVLVLTGVQQGLTVLGNLPCLGFFFWLLGAVIGLVAASLGLGAVVLSRFGTQPYPGAPEPVSAPPASLPPAGDMPAAEDMTVQPAGGETTPAASDAAQPSVEERPVAGGEVPTATRETTQPAGDATLPEDTPAPPKPRRRTPRRREPEKAGVTDSETDRPGD
jgi:cytoskeletal protein CcmA (bactofilin family)